MKRYESVPRLSLAWRTPVILRLDGRAFHTLTRNLEKPYDEAFFECMHATAQYLCKQIDGVRLAYHQSDEISLLLVDYEELNTQPWFGYDLQKLVSVSSGLATAYFNDRADFNTHYPTLAVFDARAFNLPREEVANYFVWRQQDAVRNSIQGLGQKHLSHRELQGLSCDGIQARLRAEHGVNWDEVPTHFKRGSCVWRGFTEPPHTSLGPDEPPAQLRVAWQPDLDVPIFTQDRAYVERFVYPTKPEETS